MKRSDRGTKRKHQDVDEAKLTGDEIMNQASSAGENNTKAVKNRHNQNVGGFYLKKSERSENLAGLVDDEEPVANVNPKPNG